MKIRHFLTLVSVFCLILSGCGYTTRSIVSGGAKSIYVENFVNKIDITTEVTDKRMYIAYKSGMEIDITRDVIDQFILDGNLRIMTPEKADLVLKGELIEFRKEPLRYDSNDNILDYRIKVSVNIKLTDTRDDKLIWEEKRFNGESVYRINAISEDKAVQEAEEDLAKRIVELAVEGW